MSQTVLDVLGMTGINCPPLYQQCEIMRSRAFPKQCLHLGILCVTICLNYHTHRKVLHLTSPLSSSSPF